MFSDLTLSASNATKALTPMEQQAAACNVLVLQLAIYADLATPPNDAVQTKMQRVNALLFAAEISEVAQA